VRTTGAAVFPVEPLESAQRLPLDVRKRHGRPYTGVRLAMSEESVLKVGDVVMLKSGGPKMTVDVVSQMGVECLWFDATHQGAPLKGRFASPSLKLSEE
jgi:uncharacterized protein YodC (DUF2158 family)